MSRRDADRLIPSDADLRAARIGGGDYVEIGDRFLDYFKDLASLTPSRTEPSESVQQS